MKAAARLFALRSTDPSVIGATEEALRRPGESTWAIRRCGSWLVAVAPLPGGPTHVSALPLAGGGPRSDRSEGPGFELAVAEGAEALGEHSARGRGWESVAELALASPQKLGMLPGDFTFLALAPEGKAVAVRSCGGTVPVHLFSNGGLTAVSTTVRDLIRFLPVPVEPDPLVWSATSYGCTTFPDGRGFLAGSTVVARGHAAVLEPDRAPRSVRYFDPRPVRWPEPTPARRQEHVERLRSLVMDSLENQLDPSGGNLLGLSGGVDSSVLGALAAGTLGYPVATVSFVPPSGEAREERERHYVESLGREVPFTSQLIYGLDLRLRLDHLASAPSVGFPQGHPVLCALTQASAQVDVRVVFGGEHADEVCGAPITVADWAMATPLATVLRSSGRLPFGRSDLLRWVGWRLLWAAGRPRTYFRPSLPDPIAPHIAEEYAEWYGRYRRRARGRGAWPFLSLWHNQDAWVGMGWEVSTTIGARRCLPFLSRAALELVYDCHPSELIGPGPKRLLRSAFDGAVPHEHLYRPDKGSNIIPLPAGETYAWDRPAPEVVRAMLADRWQGVLDRVRYPEIFPLAMLEAGGRSFEELSAGGVRPR